MTQIKLFMIAAVILLYPASLIAQIPNETDTTTTPESGDHNYITSPVETVNPANGSVSIRIPVGIAPDRGLTVPFTIAYDSNGSFYVRPWGNGPEYRGATLAKGTQGGWSYTYPLLSFSGTTWQIPGSDDGMITCHGSYNYVFQDANGDRHNLGLSVEPNVASPDGYDNCNNGPPPDYDGEYPSGGEGPILATTSIPKSNIDDFPAVYVDEPDGTSYYFRGGGPGTSTLTELSPTITDRNGNTVSLSESSGDQVTYTDAIGRNVLTVSGIGASPDTITAAGLSSPYQVYWTTASAQFTDNMVNLEPGVEQNCPTSESASATVVSQIVLPNDQSFSFSYDPTYGMVTKIVYPGGGYVRYVWGLNLQAEAGVFVFNVNGTPTGWTCRYDFPAVTDRYVSYDGQTEVLHQHFSYSTQWSGNNLDWDQKSTSVTTTDLVRNASYVTNYTYSGISTPWVPNCLGCGLTDQIPVENTIQYNDYGGGWLQTVTKNWQNIRLVQSEQTTLNNNTSSLKVYCYSTSEQQQEEDDYDLGTGSPSGNCANVPSGTASGALLRKTLTCYPSFQKNIVDLPSSVITKDGNGNRVAETDYSYDNNGNLNTKTVDCFSVPGGQACPQGNSTTNYSYDGNGQVTTMTDANRNPSTQYSYADNYSSCGGSAPPQSPSDAYLTQITYPSVNGVAHTVSYCYDYGSGLLLSSSTDGRQPTTYSYADPFARLTGISYPDGGSDSYSYNDAELTLTTTTAINGSEQKSTITLLNGLGAPYVTALTTDPYGSDYQVTTLDGIGRPYQVTNPFRSTSDPTYGVTTYTYDALGRTTSVLNPDSTSSATQYSGNCVTYTDESNKKRESCYDGLGRVESVFEDPSGLNYETDYTHDGNSNLIQVDQWGGPRGSSGERRRVFIYDSMSQLTNACNPESIATGSSCSSAGPWSNTYTYDDNGNLLSNTDARSETVQYQYDALNRTESQLNPSGTANACFWYDTTTVSSLPTGCPAPPSILTTGANLVDHMAYEWTSDGETGTAFGYDVMGRTTSKWDCTPATCPRGIAWILAFQYDLAGDLVSYSNGEGYTVTENYDGASHLSSVTSSPSDPDRPGTLWTANSYNAIGLTGATLGNGVSEVLQYDNRERLTSESYTNPSTLYQYGVGYFPDSSVQTVNDTANGNWTYTMDSLNRLYSASAVSGPYNGTSLQWGYDAFGNRATQTATAGSAPQPQFSMNANNQIIGYCYDSAGNLTDEGPCPQAGYPHQFAYDGVGRLISPDYGNTVYVYDASGVRVAKQVGGSSTYEFIHDLDGHEIVEAIPGPTWDTWVRGEVYAGGIHIGTYLYNTFYFAGTDWLSNEREHSQVSGEQQDTCATLPFGDDLQDCQVYGINPLHFTGKERDAESGNDYFGARYYASTMGRFLSPDYDESGDTPEPVPYAALDNPQTLNLYGYGQNNPLLLTDPTGHVPCSGVATVTITVTPSGSSMSQSPDDCPTTVDLLMSSFPHLQFPTQKPPQSTQIDEMRPMSAPVGTMDANTTIKEDFCAKQAALAVGKNAIAYDLMSKLADKATDAFNNWEGLNYPNVGGGSSGSSLPSSPGESVVNGVDKAASFVATNSAAQQFVRAALRSEGVKVSARAVGRAAETVGKDAGYLGAAYTLADAVRLYNACMSQ